MPVRPRDRSMVSSNHVKQTAAALLSQDPQTDFVGLELLCP